MIIFITFFYYCIVWFFTYVYAIHQCWKCSGVCQKVIFFYYFLPCIKIVATFVWFIIWSLTNDRQSHWFHSTCILSTPTPPPTKNRIHPVRSCIFSFIIEVIWNNHFSKKILRSGTNSLSVWGKTCCATIYNFFYLILEITIQSIIEDGAKEQTIFRILKFIFINFPN